MTNDVWINLPVRDVNKAREFYKKLGGFTLNDQHGGDHMASFFVGANKLIVNFFIESLFETFTGHKNTNTKQGTEVLFSIGAKSKKEVDEMYDKAIKAGATSYGNPAEKDGWMYGCGFVDPDGHRWNLLYMDMAKIPKS